MDKPQPFSLILKRLRLAAGLTHEALAERAGIGARTISDLERGVSRAPRADTVSLLIDALDLTADQRADLETSARQAVASSIAEKGPDNLPVQLTTIVGRESEVRDVGNLLRRNDTRLVTLTGPGGVGKTRLSLHVATQLTDVFPDGIFAVDLASVVEPAGVCEAIGLALGVVDKGPIVLSRLSARLGQQSLLLLLDNFEHLLDAAPLVSELLRGCPYIKVLATSRAALRISGEQEFPVLPRPVPDPLRLPRLEQLTEYASVLLFVDRASRVRPDFALTADNAAFIAVICARLDGLPLALELAAARTKILPPRELLHRLNNATDAPSLRLLTVGPRDAASRQRTFRETIAWSYSLLSGPDKELFRRLAVFVGGCTRAAADAICASSAEDGGAERLPCITRLHQPLDVEESLSSLTDQSLLYPGEGADGELRFQMLETIREFAWEQLVASGEEGALKRRHAKYFLAMVEATGALLFATAPKRATLAAEQGNINAALSWLVQHG